MRTVAVQGRHRGVPAVPGLLHNGWVMVAPDYVGMGTKGPTPYLIGTGEPYSSLAAARAAHQLPGLSLSDDTVVWGHSQGSHAALWTGHFAARYAPQLKVDGVAALAPVTALVPLAERVQHAAYKTPSGREAEKGCRRVRDVDRAAVLH
jgi:pimeloyl-ACP methyl ester carboxylesterase